MPPAQNGKTALVTGASRGIGAAVAQRLVADVGVCQPHARSMRRSTSPHSKHSGSKMFFVPGLFGL
jgi:NAD(P)-dependent dehydrogenase (short-subunit alcohol dehydrogenase family)